MSETNNSTDVSVALLMNEVQHQSAELSKLESRVEKIEERHETLYRMAATLENLTESVKHIDANVQGLRTEFGGNIDELKEYQEIQDKRIDELANASAKEDHETVNKIRNIAITIIAGGVIVFILSQLFPGVPW